MPNTESIIAEVLRLAYICQERLSELMDDHPSEGKWRKVARIEGYMDALKDLVTQQGLPCEEEFMQEFEIFSETIRELDSR